MSIQNLHMVLEINSGKKLTNNYSIIEKFEISDVKNLNNRSHVQECSEQVHRILLEYCVNCYPNVPVSIFIYFRIDFYFLPLDNVLSRE